MQALKRIEILAEFRVFDAARGLFVNAHCVVHGGAQQFHAGVERFPRLSAVGAVFQNHRFGKLHTDAVDGVECRKRILENHCDFVAAKFMELFLVDLQKIHAVIDNLAAFDDGVGGGDTDYCFVRDGFAAARLADDCQGFALVQIEVDAAYCLHFARVGTERNSQIFNFKLLFHKLALRSSERRVERVAKSVAEQVETQQ